MMEFTFALEFTFSSQPDINLCIHLQNIITSSWKPPTIKPLEKPKALVLIVSKAGARTVSYTHLDVYKRQPPGADFSILQMNFVLIGCSAFEFLPPAA